MGCGECLVSIVEQLLKPKENCRRAASAAARSAPKKLIDTYFTHVSYQYIIASSNEFEIVDLDGRKAILHIFSFFLSYYF